MKSNSRRQFIKDSVAATVLLSNVSILSGLVRAEGEGETTGEYETTPMAWPWKKRYWDCKRTIAGPRSTPYTEEEIQDIALDFETSHPQLWSANPTGPPTGSFYVAGPQEVEWYYNGEDVSIMQTDRTRNPSAPQAANMQIDDDYYVAYQYQYEELRLDVGVGGP